MVSHDALQSSVCHAKVTKVTFGDANFPAPMMPGHHYSDQTLEQTSAGASRERVILRGSYSTNRRAFGTELNSTSVRLPR